MRAGTDGATAEMRPAAYMVAAGHEESSKQDHHLRVFAMAKVPSHAAASSPDATNCGVILKVRLRENRFPSHDYGARLRDGFVTMIREPPE